MQLMISLLEVETIESGMDALVLMELAAIEAEDAKDMEEELPRAPFTGCQGPQEEYTDWAFIRRYRILKDSSRYVLELICP